MKKHAHKREHMHAHAYICGHTNTGIIRELTLVFIITYYMSESLLNIKGIQLLLHRLTAVDYGEWFILLLM